MNFDDEFLEKFKGYESLSGDCSFGEDRWSEKHVFENYKTDKFIVIRLSIYTGKYDVICHGTDKFKKKIELYVKEWLAKRKL